MCRQELEDDTVEDRGIVLVHQVRGFGNPDSLGIREDGLEMVVQACEYERALCPLGDQHRHPQPVELFGLCRASDRISVGFGGMLTKRATAGGSMTTAVLR